MYYRHTSLASLAQDDLYSILWIGGIATGVLIPLFVTAITIKFIGKLDDHRGDSIMGVVVGTMIRIFFSITFILLFISFVYIAFMYGTQGNLGLDAGQAIEWFLHTDWLGKTDELIETIREGESDSQAQEIAIGTVMGIYVVKFLWLLTLVGFAVLVLFSTITKVYRMVDNNPKVNSLEFSATLTGASFFGMLVIMGSFSLMNGTIETIFKVSDSISRSGISSYPPKLQQIYIDAFNPRLLTETTNTIGEL